METVEEINNRLVDVYGRDINNGLPKFRIVWSTDQREKRYGEFEVWDGDRYLRTEKGVSEVQKYGEFPNMWVLERLEPTVGNPYVEMVTNYSYEPKWIFGATHSDHKPIWKAVDLLVKGIIYGDPNRVVMTPGDIIRAEAKQKADEKEKCLTIIKNESPYLPGALHAGSAVTVPSNYKRAEDNG